MNIYRARYNNAIRIAEKINSLIDDGYLIFDENMDVVSPFIIADNGDIYQDLGNNCTLEIFVNNPNWDAGCHTPIGEFNKAFSGWTYVSPKDVQKLKI